MRQTTLAHQAEFQRYAKRTRREQFLQEIDAVMPWEEWFPLLGPRNAKAEMGHNPMALDIVPRLCSLRQWFALSDPAVEGALYEAPELRRFAGIALGRAPVPDKTTIPKIRHLLEEHDLGGRMPDAVDLHLAGRCIRTGIIVDAIALPHLFGPGARKRSGIQGLLSRLKNSHEWLCGALALINVYHCRRRPAKVDLQLSPHGA